MYRRNLGDQIKDIVEDAVSSCNYQDLNNKIKNTAQRAMDEFNRATGAFGPRDYNNWDGHPPFNGQGPGMGPDNHGGDPRFHRGPYGARPGYQNREENRSYRQNNRSYQGQQRSYQRQPSVNVPRKQKVRVKGRISSVVYTVLGTIGTTLFGTAAILLGCFWAIFGMTGTVFEVLVPCFAVATLLCIAGITVGVKKRKFISRYEIYQNLLNKHKFCEIKSLANHIGRTKGYVQKDLQKMVMLSMFPEGHFDEQKTCFIVDDETYQQYLTAQESFKVRQKEEELKKQEQESVQENEELAKAIADGKEYIRQIRKANDDIPGEEISRKLDRLEEIIRKIFICVEKHPEKLSEIRKFMEYYLPITIKLVNAYKEFDSQTIQGDNIKNSKQEIEATLDTIDQAFENLLDSLYEDEAMEVSSDISVLNTLFAQEGLTKKDFKLDK